MAKAYWTLRTFELLYLTSNRDTGALCAMKEVEIFPGDSNSEESIKQLEQEIEVLSNLKHPNIVQYYGSELVDDKFYIYLEYVHPGSLTKFIQDHCQAINESVVRNFTRHILCGLAYLHSTKTIHRDIKGANLLVDAYGVVKLADFGMAKHLHGHRTNLSIKGTPYWMAPELLQSNTHKGDSKDVALAIDIWSLGCTVIEMLTGKPPWSEYEAAAAMFKVLQENPPLPDDLSDECQDFLHCCFRRNPAERPTAAMLLEHRFLRGACQPHSFPLASGSKSEDNLHKRTSRSTLRMVPHHHIQLLMPFVVCPLPTKIEKDSDTFTYVRAVVGSLQPWRGGARRSFLVMVDIDPLRKLHPQSAIHLTYLMDDWGGGMEVEFIASLLLDEGFDIIDAMKETTATTENDCA
ncbi:hypothetical protein Leryth_013659 [Lithospermum erythrorhizon]|nr:hypothetical protein Leryth_013659 [Lithospermum erythrorhizon]